MSDFTATAEGAGDGGAAADTHATLSQTLAEESLGSMYRDAHSKYSQFEESPEIQGDEECFNALLQALEAVQSRADREGVISKNESVDDINTGALQYLFLPYFYARVCAKCPTLPRRLHYLGVSNGYLHQYVERCVRTGVTTEEEVEALVKDGRRVGVFHAHICYAIDIAIAIADMN
jgi:hypothetical protein